jgi:hypothetical protein
VSPDLETKGYKMQNLNQINELEQMGALIVYHLTASGPMGFSSIRSYCINQFVGNTEDVAIGEAVESLIERGEIEFDHVFQSYDIKW